MSLSSPFGFLEINQPLPISSDGMAYLFEILDITTTPYQIVPAKFRPVVDSLSQADGSTIQPPYIDGMVASFELTLEVCPHGDERTKTAACGEDLRLMDQLLMGVLNSLRTIPAAAEDQQYRWRPTGATVDRLLNGVVLASWPVPDFRDSPLVRVKVGLGSPYPYAVDDMETTTTIADGTFAHVPNGGNCDYFLLARAHGPSTGFVILNNDTGRLVSYDSTRPGAAAIAGGHYAEIDFFASTILLDGIDDAAHDLIAGLDPAATDLFPLAPGGNQINISGAIVDIITQDAWV